MKPLIKEAAVLLWCPFGNQSSIAGRCKTDACMSWSWQVFEKDTRYRPEVAEYNVPKMGVCELIGGNNEN